MSFLQTIKRFLQGLLNNFFETFQVSKKAICSAYTHLICIFNKLTGRKSPKRRPKLDCFRLPPEVSRWPDPCLYSQKYLRARNEPVIWDNPDIKIFNRQSGEFVPSGELTANTDYSVEARITNASFDAALGVLVGCTYRNWGIETDNRQSIELDASGNPVVKILHIAPWGDKLAIFNWRTPDVQDQHICIEVKCYHPADREPGNNIGQENTTVRSASSGSSQQFMIPFFNAELEDRLFTLRADNFTFSDKMTDLTLREVKSIKRSKNQIINPAKIDIRTHKELKTKSGTFSYISTPSIHDIDQRNNYPLSPGWAIRIAEPEEVGALEWTVKIPAKTTINLNVEVGIPGDAQSGHTESINLTAHDPKGSMTGGVTLIIKVE